MTQTQKDRKEIFSRMNKNIDRVEKIHDDMETLFEYSPEYKKLFFEKEDLFTDNKILRSIL